MRILVFGAGGQVGFELLRAPVALGTTVIGVTRAEADVTDPVAVTSAMDRYTPDIVINAAAYTAVDKAESDPTTAFNVNATGPEILGRATAARSIPLLHISTDYVFDGAAQRPYREADPTTPLGVYGASKLAGEIALRTVQPAHVIVRTAWVFGRHGGNFVKTMQRLGRERDEVRVVADQHGSPTAAKDIAVALLDIARQIHTSTKPTRTGMFGNYHLTNAGETTWHGLAEAVFADLERRTGRRPRCIPITTDQYPTAARRPANSRLDCTNIERTFGLQRRSWQSALADVLDELVQRA